MVRLTDPGNLLRWYMLLTWYVNFMSYNLIALVIGEPGGLVLGGGTVMIYHGVDLPNTQSYSPVRWQQSAPVYESNEESGSLTLSILSTGHFFISQRQTLLEGFSLLSAHTWLKVGNKSDCLLFGSQNKLEYHRMFRVQFSGSSTDNALENCSSCIQKLKSYVPVQNGSIEKSSQSVPEERIPLTHLVQSVLNPQTTEMDKAYPPPVLSPEELSAFLKICLLDQHFPAFVEAVEKELHKLTETRNEKHT
ncbi:meiotic recombination protein REC114 [Pelodytes ibericus]